MTKVRVKLNDWHHAMPDQVKDGYLASNGVIQMYPLHEARKKAKMFGGGTFEEVKLASVMTRMTIMTIPEDALLFGIEKLLDGREAFKDADKSINEKIYHGDIFETIASELEADKNYLKASLLYPKDKVIEQLDELAILVDTDYVLITRT